MKVLYAGLIIRLRITVQLVSFFKWGVLRPILMSYHYLSLSQIHLIVLIYETSIVTTNINTTTALFISWSFL